MNYFDIYKQRLNRFGNDYQSRIQGAREYNFDLYLLKSVYRVDFLYEDMHCVGSLERNKQDESEVRQYLLTPVNLKMPGGTVLDIINKDGDSQRWMIYYLETIQASGYNRYIVLKMTHFLTWTARDGSTQTSWAYMYGQEDNMLRDEIRSRSRMDTIYGVYLKSSFFVLPKNDKLRKDDYFVIGEKPYQEYYRVTGYDMQSTDGVEYVTVDPVYEFDLSAAPSQTINDNAEDFFWLNGGVSS